MKITVNQIAAQLNGRKSPPPVIMVFGDEPLQSVEACDFVRGYARQNGFTEREVMHVDNGFDWDTLLAASNTLSLFGDRRLLELRIPGGKPGDKGSKAITAYLENPPQDTLLLITSGNIDWKSQKSKWFSCIAQAGLAVQAEPVDTARLPAWIEQRMKAKGLRPTREAVSVLAERVEGNLLAAAQEIDKLSLHFKDSEIDYDEVLSSVSDNSRFDSFELTNTALAGNASQAARILARLREEGVVPIQLLGAVTWTIRNLCIMSEEISQGQNIDAVMRKHRVRENLKPLYRQCLQTRKPSRWQNLLIRIGHLDKLIKGAETGNIWDELLQLSLQIADIRPVAATASGARL